METGADRLNPTWWQMFRLARRWWMLLLLAPLIAGAAAAAVTSLRAPTYSAEATLLVDPSQGEGALDFGVIDAIQYQAETYERLIEHDPVLLPVIDELGLSYDIDTLRKQISGKAVAGTQLFLVTASDRDPERAAAVANAVAARMLTYVEGLAIQAGSASRAELDRQIVQTRQEAEDAATRLEQLEAGADADEPAIRRQIASLRATVEQRQGLLPQLLLTAQQMEIDAAAARSRVVPGPPATVPDAPTGRGLPLVVLLAVVGGLLATAGALILLDAIEGVRRAGITRPILAD